MSGLINKNNLLTQDRSRTFSRKLFIANLQRLEDGDYVDITRFVTDLSISYTMDMASSVSFNIIDQGLRMAEKNYFSVGRDIIYETQTIGSVDGRTGEIRNVRQLFEIASVTVSQGPGGSPSFSVQCYTKAIQQMKRDKNPGAIKGSGSTYIQNAAKKYGLKFYGEQTSKSKQITKSSGSKQADSLWDVMTRLASDAKFVLFEVDGYLIFASETWLLNKWGSDYKYESRDVKDKKTGKTKRKLTTKRWIPLQFKNDAINYVGRKNVFRLTEYPQITESDNDAYAANGSCVVERTNGTQIRPGMTAYVGLIPGMSNYVLIESVSFQEMVPDPVSVAFRTPTKDETKVKIRQIKLGQTYQQTYVAASGSRPTVKKAAAAAASQITARDRYGKITTTVKLDSRIINYPKPANQYLYPVMNSANITTAYPLLLDEIDAIAGYKNIKSTNNVDSSIVTGNLNLYERPVFKRSTSSNKLSPLVVSSYFYTFQSGSEWLTVLIPKIYTQSGVAVIKTEAQAITKYTTDGGYLGSAKHFGVFRGNSKNTSIANARDYLYLLTKQQELFVLPKRFPFFYGIHTIPNTPGYSDSNWA